MEQYLKYTLKNLEPLRIADKSNSQSGQTMTLRYIPGSAIRGLIINSLAKESDFQNIKKFLFSNKIKYLNAYITANEKELIPSPKGFYEDKKIVDGKKEIQNVVINGEFSEGYKRAFLGRYCYIDSDCIHYYTVDTSSDMKIEINVEENEEQKVFRNEYITENYIFTGYIAIDKEELKERIKQIFKHNIFLGNARSAGLGVCEVLSCEYVDVLPYKEYMEDRDLKGHCYMLLLSNMVMRNSLGELCGIDIETLQELMEVENLAIKYCSTSTVNVKGYNRTWGMKIPSAVMFEQGSVFRFTFDGVLKKETMQKIVRQGLGIRLNEGFGRVLFLKEYETVKYKSAEEYPKERNIVSYQKLSSEDRKTLINAAKNYYRRLLYQAMEKYIVENPIRKGNVSNSQLGIIESFTTAFQYNPEQAKKSIKNYFEHASEKENQHNTQKERNSIQKLKQYIQEEILNAKDLEELLNLDQNIRKKDTIMEIPKSELLSDKEIDRIKLELITEMIRYDNKKKEDNNGSTISI